MGKQWKQCQTLFFWAPKSLQMVTAAMKLKDGYSLFVFQWSCMDVRVGMWRKLSAEELMLLNCGVGEDSWESLGLQRDPTSPFWRRSALGFLWKEWCWSWNSNTSATSCEELTHWKRLWCWEGLGAGEKGTTEDEMAGWHHWLDGREFERTLGVGDGQGGLACCNSWGHKESDMTEQLNWTELRVRVSTLEFCRDTIQFLTLFKRT